MKIVSLIPKENFSESIYKFLAKTDYLHVATSLNLIVCRFLNVSKKKKEGGKGGVYAFLR